MRCFLLYTTLIIRCCRRICLALPLSKVSRSIYGRGQISRVTFCFSTLVEIFEALQTPRNWISLAEYLRSQQELVKAAGDAAELLAIDAVARARDVLRNLELEQYWDSKF